MSYKLAATDDFSFSLLYKKMHIIDEKLLQIFHLAKTFFSVFSKPRFAQIDNTRTQHLHYEVVHLDGKLNINNSARMKKKIFQALLNNKSILLEFTKLNFIDSSGIAILVESLHRANISGLKFVIVGADHLPLKMLELSRLDTVFELFNSIHDVKR